MRPRGRAVNGWDEMGPDPRKPLSFSLITVTQTSLHGTSTTVYLNFQSFFLAAYRSLRPIKDLILE